MRHNIAWFYRFQARNLVTVFATKMSMIMNVHTLIGMIAFCIFYGSVKVRNFMNDVIVQ